MTPNRIAATVLVLLLAALLAWSVLQGVGDLRLRLLLGAGIALGAVYAWFGRLPDWLVRHSGDSLRHDDDPANLSYRVYLPILLAAAALAGLALVIGLAVL